MKSPLRFVGWRGGWATLAAVGLVWVNPARAAEPSPSPAVAATPSPVAAAAGEAPKAGAVAAKPLFRDPVHDGAADPVVVWNPLVKRWWMFYTNRRANSPDPNGVAWVHGTAIGIAESADEGATWKYVGTADIEAPPDSGGKDVTFWAPDIVRGDDGLWQMFVVVVPGVFTDWNHPRAIVRVTSADLRKWTNPQPIPLATGRVIDPSLLRMPDGEWRMWYNNEPEGKSIHLTVSRDLKSWTEKGRAFTDRGCEGPKVFRWQGKYWLIADQWRGLAVYRSDDGLTWTPQNRNLLQTPGKGEDDQVKGQHPDVVVSGERAWLFYFTHPGQREGNPNHEPTERRRSSLQVVELQYKDGWLDCDRDQPTHIQLTPLADKP